MTFTSYSYAKSVNESFAIFRNGTALHVSGVAFIFATQTAHVLNKCDRAFVVWLCLCAQSVSVSGWKPYFVRGKMWNMQKWSEIRETRYPRNETKCLDSTLKFIQITCDTFTVKQYETKRSYVGQQVNLNSFREVFSFGAHIAFASSYHWQPPPPNVLNKIAFVSRSVFAENS